MFPRIVFICFHVNMFPPIYVIWQLTAVSSLAKSILQIVESSPEWTLREVLFRWSYRLTKQSYKYFHPILLQISYQLFFRTQFSTGIFIYLILTSGTIVVHNIQLGHLCRFDVRFTKISYLERITSINQYRNDKQRKVCSCEDVNTYLEYQSLLKLAYDGRNLKWTPA